MARYERLVSNILHDRLQGTTTNIDDIINSKNLNDCVIDSLDFKVKTKKLLKMLKKENTDPVGKIKIADFLCNRLSDVIVLSLDKREIIIKELFPVIYNGTNLILPIRLRYLRFRNENVSYQLSCDLFRGDIKSRMQIVPYFQILHFILKCYLAQNEIKQLILDEFENIFSHEDTDMYTKMQIADIYILNERFQRGNEMLNEIRNEEYVINHNQHLHGNNDIGDAKNSDTIYDDTQNVHDEYVNKSVLIAFINLINTYTAQEFNPEEVKKVLTSSVSGYDTVIDTVLERIEIDTSKFTFELSTFSLHNAFSSLWIFINQHEHKEELYKRLVEEMVSMEKYCSTGHLSRFINVIQGFTKHEALCIKISDEKQIQSVIFNFLDKKLINSPNEVQESMMETCGYKFYDYITLTINNEIDKWIEEYGDIKTYIVSTIQKYSNWYYWKYDKKLSWYKFKQNDIVIEDDCFGACSHTIIINNVKNKWSKDQIISYCKKNQLEIPLHFN